LTEHNCLETAVYCIFKNPNRSITDNNCFYRLNISRNLQKYCSTQREVEEFLLIFAKKPYAFEYIHFTFSAAAGVYGFIPNRAAASTK